MRQAPGLGRLLSVWIRVRPWHQCRWGGVLYFECESDVYRAWAGGKGTRVKVRVDSTVRDVGGAKEQETGMFSHIFWVEREGLKVMPGERAFFLHVIVVL